VLGLGEGAWLLREQDRQTLHGHTARLFRRGAEPVEFAPGAELGALLLSVPGGS
jgi:dipeptidase E